MINLFHKNYYFMSCNTVMFLCKVDGLIPDYMMPYRRRQCCVENPKLRLLIQLCTKRKLRVANSSVGSAADSTFISHENADSKYVSWNVMYVHTLSEIKVYSFGLTVLEIATNTAWDPKFETISSVSCQPQSLSQVMVR